MYLPGVPVGPMTGVAVIPPGHRMPPPRPPLAGGVQVLTKCFFQSSFPVSDVDARKMLSETPVSIAICFGPAGVFTRSDDQRRKQRVHLPRLIVELDLPQ